MTKDKKQPTLEQINGFNIIATYFTPADHMTRAGRYILVEREHEHSPYVTAWQGYDEEGNLDNSWCHGNYMPNKKTALEDFIRRIEN